MASSKEMMARAKARKQAQKVAKSVMGPLKFNLYDAAELQRNIGPARSITFPEGNVRQDTDVANVIVYPAGSDTPSLAKMTNSGAVYMAWLGMEAEREHEYLMEIHVKGNPDGIMVQSGVFSKEPVTDSNIVKALSLRVLSSLPDGIRQKFKGEVQTRFDQISNHGRKVGWVRI